MKNNKRGFSLIEMMIVIAIVAVLIAIIIPIMNGNTDKAGAATNASNLRNVEGQMLSIMLLDPEAFNAEAKHRQQVVIDFEHGAINATIGKSLEEAQADLDQAKLDLENYEKQIATKDQAIAAQNTTVNNAKAALDKEDAGANERVITLKASKVNHLGNGCSWSLFGGWTHSAKCNGLDSQIAAAEAAATKYNSANAAYISAAATLATMQAERAAMNATHTGYTKAVERAQQGVDAVGKVVQNRHDQLDEQERLMYTYEAVDGWITLDDEVTKIQAPASQKVDKDGVTIDKDVQMIVYVDATEHIFWAQYNTYDKDDFAKVADGTAAE